MIQGMNRKDVNQYMQTAAYGAGLENSTVLLTFKNKIILYTVFLSLLLKNYYFWPHWASLPRGRLSGYCREMRLLSSCVGAVATAASFAVERTPGVQASAGVAGSSGVCGSRGLGHRLNGLRSTGFVAPRH